jgi:hypothetical protein
VAQSQINTTTGVISQVNLTVDGTDYNILYHQFSGELNPGEPITIVEIDTLPDFDLGFDLSLPLSSLIGYGGGPVCSSSNDFGYCGSPEFQQGQIINYLTSGTLEPQSTAITPEPFTFALFGTGLLVFGIANRCGIRRI